MTTYPIAWYGLWLVVSICGVSSWYLRHFTERVQTLRSVALLGVASMLTLVAWTWLEF